MTDAEVIAFINEWIIANGNNEITADVLRPVLLAIENRRQQVTGNLEDLTTDDISSLVAAINEVKNLLPPGSAGVKLYTGTDVPSVTPPSSFNYADFYMQVNILNQPIQLYQFDGFTWVMVQYGGGGGTDPVARDGDLKLKTKGYVGGVVNTAETIEYGDFVFGIGADENQHWDCARYENITADGNVQNRANYTPLAWTDSEPLT